MNKSKRSNKEIEQYDKIIRIVDSAYNDAKEYIRKNLVNPHNYIGTKLNLK